MRHLNMASYAFDFDRFDALETFITSIGFMTIGAELSIREDAAYMEKLCANRHRFENTYITMHGPFEKVEASAPAESAAHRTILEAYHEAFRICALFQAESMVMHTNHRPFEANEKAGLQANAYNTIRQIESNRAGSNTQLLVENVGLATQGTLLFHEADFPALFRELPTNIGCLFDIGHAIINGWDMERMIAHLGERITSFHLHQNDGVSDLHLPLFNGAGILQERDIRALLKTMERYAPNADWIIEYAPGEDITPDLLTEEVRRLAAYAGV